MSAWCEETPSVHGSGGPVDTKLHRIAEKARKEPQFKFTSLYHLMNEELLRECFKWLRKDAAAGIDEMTKEEYAENLDANLTDLITKLYRMSYRPQPVRRKYIPKPGSDKQRSLGIPCLEDKLVQAGLVRITRSSIRTGLHRRLLWIPSKTQLPSSAEGAWRNGRERAGQSHSRG